MPTTVAAVPTTVAAAPRDDAARGSAQPRPRRHSAARGRGDPEARAARGRSRRARAAARRQLPGGGESVRDLDAAGGQNAAVIQLLIACSTETVQKAIDSGNASQLVILPVNFKGRDCYRLAWGVYPSSSKATAALRDVPEYFRNGGATPKVLGASEVVP